MILANEKETVAAGRSSGTLVLTRRDVAELLPMRQCIAAVERAFALHARGLTDAPGVLGVHAGDGGFHVKTAGMIDANQSAGRERHLFVTKVNANFPGNPERWGLPTIQGILVLFDAECGRPLAVIDSIEITSRRTAAATAVAAKYLALPDAATVTIAGCGEQGRSQVRAIVCVRDVRRVLAFDAAPARATLYAHVMSEELALEVEPVASLAEAAHQSEIIVTCTTATRAILGDADVAPGCFVAAVGADAPQKQEIEPALLAASTVVVDLLEQCAAFGDLHHALQQGALRREDVHAELHEIVGGTKAGRRSARERIIFDSTGTALQDVAAAALVYDRALMEGRGSRVDFGTA